MSGVSLETTSASCELKENVLWIAVNKHVSISTATKHISASVLLFNDPAVNREDTGLTAGGRRMFAIPRVSAAVRQFTGDPNPFQPISGYRTEF